MDVAVPTPPPSYDAYRQRVRAFITENKPDLDWGAKAHIRVPDSADELRLLRDWVAALYDAGFVLDRFLDEPPDPLEQEILEDELNQTGIPYLLGNPLVSGAFKTFGTPQQRRTFLPPMARGDHIWTQLFSEPNAGSDLTSLQTTARRDGDDYVVNGQKVWSTWAQDADFGFLLARSEPEPGSKGISAFILDMHAPGVETRPLREITGAADFNEVFFTDVRVPAGNLIGPAGQGWLVANTSLAMERGGVGAIDNDGLVAGLVSLARGRQRSSGPAIDDAAIRQQIARFAARSRIQRYLGFHVATKAAGNETSAADLPALKIWSSELNLEALEFGLELQGPAGTLVGGDPLAVEAGHWQDSFLYARALTIAGGSNEIMRNLIAERELGLPREPRGK